MTDIERLERLNALREKGALTGAEFAREKARLLSPRESERFHRPWLGLGAAAILVVSGAFYLQASPKQQWEPVPAMQKAPATAPPPSAPGVQAIPVVNPPSAMDVRRAVASGVAPDTSNADEFTEARRFGRKVYGDQPVAIRNVLGDYAGANVLCRGSSDEATVAKWCPIRDALGVKLREMGMCYGRPTDRSAAESDWHACDVRDGPPE